MQTSYLAYHSTFHEPGHSVIKPSANTCTDIIKSLIDEFTDPLLAPTKSLTWQKVLHIGVLHCYPGIDNLECYLDHTTWCAKFLTKVQKRYCSEHHSFTWAPTPPLWHQLLQIPPPHVIKFWDAIMNNWPWGFICMSYTYTEHIIAYWQVLCSTRSSTAPYMYPPATTLTPWSWTLLTCSRLRLLIWKINKNTFLP